VNTFVGIDLGTTYSAVAYIDNDGKPQIIPDEAGNHLTPSVVSFEENRILVGDEAKEQQALGKREAVSFFKRSMGDPNFVLSFHGQSYTPVDLSSLVLARLKKQAEQFFGAPVTDAVITVPAYFTHIERTATIEAGQKIGLRVLKIISEPTAAALAYGLRPGGGREQKVLVYDLGGGTFDISLVAIMQDDLRVLGTDGDHNLGGKDWDDCLISYVAQQFEEEFGAELIGDDFNTLRVQSEQLKRALSVRDQADIRVHAGGNSQTYTVTRATFESLTGHLLERTRTLTERVLQDQKLGWNDISGVLLVGGSTRMPMVRALVERMSGKQPMGGVHPDEAVALGAAIQAAMEMEQVGGATAPKYRLAGRKTTTDAVAHSLGMIAESSDRTRYINSILIAKNKPIPSEWTRPYEMNMRRGGNTTLEVFLTQGESDDPQQCVYLGKYVFTDFPPVNTKVAIMDITYRYDKNGVVQISAVERSSGQPLKLTVEPVPSDVPARFAGRPIDQQVREHMTVYLAFDLSGSMSGEPLAKAQEAAEQFISQCDLTTTSVGLISFSDSVRVEQEATQNAKNISRAIRDLSIGRTGYGNRDHPFRTLFDHLSKVKGTRYAIVLADGVWACQSSAIKEARRCHQAEIQVIAIGFGSADSDFLAKIASSSEQSFFTDLNQLGEAFSTIARELTETGGELPTGKRFRWGR
jgi:molecular chaperone DnaK